MSTLESYLTTIANAIREKKGTTEPINASNFASEILSIQGGGSLNVAYSLTPPTDTSKIWLKCAEPSGVEVQNYIGECAVSEVANWGTIDNPVDAKTMLVSVYSPYAICYIGNNKLGIIGSDYYYKEFDLITKTYKKVQIDYSESNSSSVATNGFVKQKPLFKDNKMYYWVQRSLYSYDIITNKTKTLYTQSSTSYDYYYMWFNSDNEIWTIGKNSSIYIYKFNLDTNTMTQSSLGNDSYFSNVYYYSQMIYANGKLYSFVHNYNDTTSKYSAWALDISSGKFNKLNNFSEFLTNSGLVSDIATRNFERASTVYDGERYIYIIGGYNGSNTTIKYDTIIRYDIINDIFELLEQKLISANYQQYSFLIDNRIYTFGGYGDRSNQIDYFDLQYPLTQNNCIITTNTINTDNALPLINTEKLKINSNIASAYLGNANNLAEKVNAYYWNGSTWKGINCEDYTEE